MDKSRRRPSGMPFNCRHAELRAKHVGQRSKGRLAPHTRFGRRRNTFDAVESFLQIRSFAEIDRKQSIAKRDFGKHQGQTGSVATEIEVLRGRQRAGKKTIEKLKLEQEFSETVTEEEFYETAVYEDESQLPSQSPLESLDVLNYYLQDEGAPRRSRIITTSPLGTHPTSVQHRPEASRTPTPPTSPVSSASPNTAVDIPPENAQPRDESANTAFTFPQPRPAEAPRPAAGILTSIQPRKENTSTTFTLAQPRPAVMPTSTAETRPHTAGTPDVGAPVFIPMRAQPPADNAQQIAETLTRVTQLQRLPQANPDVYRGDEKDKTRFFLWETAFDALVDSAPVSAQQKLHLLYQHLDSKPRKSWNICSA